MLLAITPITITVGLVPFVLLASSTVFGTNTIPINIDTWVTRILSRLLTPPTLAWVVVGIVTTAVVLVEVGLAFFELILVRSFNLWFPIEDVIVLVPFKTVYHKISNYFHSTVGQSLSCT